MLLSLLRAVEATPAPATENCVTQPLLTDIDTVIQFHMVYDVNANDGASPPAEKCGAVSDRSHPLLLVCSCVHRPPIALVRTISKWYVSSVKEFGAH